MSQRRQAGPEASSNARARPSASAQHEDSPSPEQRSKRKHPRVARLVYGASGLSWGSIVDTVFEVGQALFHERTPNVVLDFGGACGGERWRATVAPERLMEDAVRDINGGGDADSSSAPPRARASATRTRTDAKLTKESRGGSGSGNGSGNGNGKAVASHSRNNPNNNSSSRGTIAEEPDTNSQEEHDIGDYHQTPVSTQYLEEEEEEGQQHKQHDLHEQGVYQQQQQQQQQQQYLRQQPHPYRQPQRNPPHHEHQQQQQHQELHLHDVSHASSRAPHRAPTRATSMPLVNYDTSTHSASNTPFSGATAHEQSLQFRTPHPLYGGQQQQQQQGYLYPHASSEQEYGRMTPRTQAYHHAHLPTSPAAVGGIALPFAATTTPTASST